MSKSLARVKTALSAAGISAEPIEMQAETRTAQQAATAAGCSLDQIAKSIIFQGESGALYLFVTAGGNQVDASKASDIAGEPLGRADIATVRQKTGFAIGGVSPLGHLNPIRLWMDPRLMQFDEIWAAAGTPRHIFPIAPQDLLKVSGAALGDFTIS